MASLEYENKDLREFRHKNEAASSRMAEEARAAAAEIAALRVEVARRTEVAQRLDNGQHDSEIKVERLETRVAMLEKELDNRKAEVNRLDNELRKEHGVRMRLGQELEEKVGLVRKREGGIRAVSADLLKANEIIKKLQDQGRDSIGKKFSLKYIGHSLLVESSLLYG